MADLPAPGSFYRSRLFCPGMPGLLFLLWAWWKSNAVRLKLEMGEGWLWSSQGKVCWHALDDPSGEWVATVDYREGKLSARPQEEMGRVCGFGITTDFVSQTPIATSGRYWFPPFRWEAVQLDASSSYRLISVPYWLSTGSYLGLWLGGLTGWQRRKVFLSKISTARLP